MSARHKPSGSKGRVTKRYIVPSPIRYELTTFGTIVVHLLSGCRGGPTQRLPSPFRHAPAYRRRSLFRGRRSVGAAQIRVEYQGEAWLVSGDYKTDADLTCTPWEAMRCHTFFTESAFDSPIHRWPSQQVVFDEMNAWWRAKAAEDLTRRQSHSRFRRCNSRAAGAAR